MAFVNSARYWKDNIRIFKVKRDEETGVQIVDAINSSYTQDDISIIIAINAMKNVVYVEAKENPVFPPELFWCILGDHFMENTLIQVMQK
ncbi:Uricase [Golovinomyces cichoracearum]|uniref:factor independent urate hydroxylase n=1 Tax=Golovinomyces cichoracearum TaxID=62708 RepID=A0A420INJ4_9PEZI|nr:Uricase [Golovinomyces cichoracearum]